MADHYRLEHAKTWRSICKECKSIIPENGLRLGKGTTDVKFLKSWYHLSCYPCDAADNVETFLKEKVADNTNGGLLSIENEFHKIVKQMKRTSTRHKMGRRNIDNSNNKAKRAHKAGKVSVKRVRVLHHIPPGKKRNSAKDGEDSPLLHLNDDFMKEDSKGQQEIAGKQQQEEEKVNYRMWRSRTFKRAKSRRGPRVDDDNSSSSLARPTSPGVYPSPLSKQKKMDPFNLSIESVPDDELVLSKREIIETDLVGSSESSINGTTAIAPEREDISISEDEDEDEKTVIVDEDTNSFISEDKYEENSKRRGEESPTMTTPAKNAKHPHSLKDEETHCKTPTLDQQNKEEELPKKVTPTTFFHESSSLATTTTTSATKKRKTYAKRKKWKRSSSRTLKPMLKFKITKYA